MIWKDGTFYEGEWSKDIYNGLGKLKFPDGSIQEGTFLNNVLIYEPPEAPKKEKLML